jgi:uncharacterized protein (DUF58 family)
MLAPALLAAIGDLEFVARVTVEGALSGLHRSPFHGYSAEFSQYRHYRPGDDLKYVDWKLLARTDRIYTKQFRETTNVRLQVVLDASASMGFSGEGGVSKLAYGRMLAGALAHLLSTQGDAVGLTAYDSDVRAYLASRSGRSHLRAMLVALSKLTAAGSMPSTAALRRAVDLMRGRGIITLISDLYDDEEGVAAELRRAARMGHDVTVFHVLTPEERTWTWNGEIEAVDSESGARTLVSADEAAANGVRVEAFVRRWRDRCLADGIIHVLAPVEASPSHTLREYLLRRAGGGGR